MYVLLNSSIFIGSNSKVSKLINYLRKNKNINHLFKF